MSITLSALQKQRRDTAANWTAENPTLLAGEIGIESDTGKIKIGNGSTAWASLGYQGIIPSSGTYPLSQLLMPSGTASAPSISFDGDTNTGVYRTGADQLALATGGSGRLFVDASGRVGMNTASPQRALHSSGGVSDNCILATSIAGNAFIGFADVGTTDQTGLSVRLGSSGNSLVFQTGGTTERLRITSAGLVGIGTSAPDGIVHARQDVTSGNYQARLYVQNTDQKTFIGSYWRTGVGQYSVIQSTNDAESVAGVLLLNPSGGNVGIGTTSPTAALAFGTSTDSVASTPGKVRYYDDGTNIYGVGVAGGATLNYCVPSAANHVWYRGTSESARIDSSGRLLVGTSSNFGFSTKLGVMNGSHFIGTYRNDAYAYSCAFLKTRGTSAPGTILQNGDEVGNIDWYGDDGTSTTKLVARIQAFVDGTPGANDMPGRLVFSTTADGASSPTERMRIRSDGRTTIAHANNTDVFETASDATSGFTSSLGVLSFRGYAPNNTAARFLYCGDTTALRAELRSNGGLANYQANNVNLSDRNAKKDITSATDTWDCIKEWEIVNYRYKDQPDDADLSLGVIAQQVAESCPEVITVFQEATEDEPEKLGVKEQQMYWMAIKALQEAQVRIEQLEQRLTDAGIA
jgi:hypothetical protein